MGKLISIHALREEGDICTASEWSRYIISIHALREEGDASVWMSRFGKTRFLSTPSARRATCSWAFRRAQSQNFYPRPPRGGRRQGPRPPSTGPEYFYPRPPRGGRRQGSLSQSVPHRFLSTPSARRATAEYSVDGAKRYHFYPRPPRGGRQGRFIPILNPIKFLSTPSARRATCEACKKACMEAISIHALREEGDSSWEAPFCVWKYFYPRPPRGGRHAVQLGPHQIRLFLSTPSARRATKADGKDSIAVVFLSTPSARRATYPYEWSCTTHLFLSTPSARRATPCIETLLCVASISIHALREEGDSFQCFQSKRLGTFLSTPSARRATVQHHGDLPAAGISIHALREEGDRLPISLYLSMVISIHALREEGDSAFARV